MKEGGEDIDCDWWRWKIGRERIQTSRSFLLSFLSLLCTSLLLFTSHHTLQMLHSPEEEKVEEKSWDEEALEEEDDLGDLPSLPGSGTGIKSRLSVASQLLDVDNKVHFVVQYIAVTTHYSN